MNAPAVPQSSALRILMLGPLRHPHVEHLALAVQEQGHEVMIAGEVLWPDMPESPLAGSGIPVSELDGRFVVWFRRLLAQFRPHVVHAHWMPFALRAWVYGAPRLIANAWGSDVYRAERFDRIANRLVARAADVAMADSADLLRALERLGARRDRLALVNWGVDLGTFYLPEEPRPAIRERLGLGPGPLVMSPRWVREPYNPEIVIGAFERVADEIEDAQLVLKHPSPKPPEIDLGRHRDRVHVIGQVPYERMGDYYRAADVCISVPSSDSSPRSVWEAMACGCPCVLSDLPWVHELIEPGRDALVTPQAVEPVAAALRRLLTEDGLAAEMGGRARRLVEEHRNRDKEMRRLSEIYARLAGQRRRRLRLLL